MPDRIALLLLPCLAALTVGAQDREEKEREAERAPVQIDWAPAEAQRQHNDLFRRVVQGQEPALKEWESLKPPGKVNALIRALGFGPAELRQHAVVWLKDLSAEDDPDGLAAPALVHAALKDSDEAVREAAHAEVVARKDEKGIGLLAERLLDPQPEARERAAKALRGIGGPRVYEAIVERWREIWGPGPRAHMVVARQRAYVSDYDISGDAYDPVVRTFLTGAVLDVKPLLIYADFFIIKALREVTGVDAGNDRAAWERWLAEDKRRRAANEPGPLPNDAREKIVIRGKE